MKFPLSCMEIAVILHAPLANVEASWPAIEECMDALGMDGLPAKIAALATVRVECPPFKPIHEYGGEDYLRKYEGRADLGNTHPGDGVLYCGRGFIQVTGRDNYEKYGRALGTDLVADPDKALTVEVAASILAMFFRDHAVAFLAASGSWGKIRKAVNGGTNGLPEFLGYVAALQAAVAAGG